MIARSVDVTLVNKTSNELFAEVSTLAHGIWSTFPPAPIQPFSQADWASESDSIFICGQPIAGMMPRRRAAQSRRQPG